jgi:putative metal-binding protein
MRLGRIGTMLTALAVGLAFGAPAHAIEIDRPWGYAFIDPDPFLDPSSRQLLPTTQVFPRGQIRDKEPPDGDDVRMTVLVFTPGNSSAVTSYHVNEADFNTVSFDRRLDIQPFQVSYLRYDFCHFTPGDNTLKDCEHVRLGRPAPPPPPQPGGGSPPPPADPDGDGDGVPASADCRDNDAAVWPGGVEVPGNGIDDDCAGGDEPARIAAGVKNDWSVIGARTRVRELRVRDAPRNATVQVRCKGRRCPFRVRRTAVKPNGSAKLGRFFRKRLRPGITIEIRITAPNSIGKVVRYRIRRGRLPADRTLCLPLGATKPQRRC